jgi:hypothetical protein
VRALWFPRYLSLCNPASNELGDGVGDGTDEEGGDEDENDGISGRDVSRPFLLIHELLLPLNAPLSRLVDLAESRLVPV